MAARSVAVKKYVVRLDGEERAQLQALISKGKSAARRLTKARMLLKADISQAGEGCSDSEIVRALGGQPADSDDGAHSFRDDGAQCSGMMPPG